MADSRTRKVRDIFDSMESGPTSSGRPAAWLQSHSGSLGLFIDGSSVCPSDRQTASALDSSGESVCSALCAVDEDVSACVSSSAGGFKAWAALSCHRRAQVLRRLAAAVQKHSQCVSEVCDLFQPPSSPAALVRLVQYHAGWAQLRDLSIPDWSPRGVVAVVVSDDASVYCMWLKVLPALAMGNSVVLVSGPQMAPPSLLLAELCAEAGLPAGALNVLSGSDVSLAGKVVASTGISFLTYCGNKQDGEALCRQTAGWCVPVALSTSPGSVCPVIIFESADIDSALDSVMEAAFKKNREYQWVLYVQESVLDGAIARLKVRMAGMKAVPLLCEADRALVDEAVQEAHRQGATSDLHSPCPPAPSGALYPPTVLSGVAPSCQAVVSPAPGPILPLMSFRGSGEGITLANHSPFVQAASVWTEDLTLSLESVKSLCAGTVWLNSLAVMDPSLSLSGLKEVGNCTDGGREGLYQFLRPSASPPLRCFRPSQVDYATFGAPSPMVCEMFILFISPARVYQHLVGGRQSKAESGCSKAVRSAGGALLAHCPDGGPKDVRNAVEAAIKVQPSWARSPSARVQSLYSLAGSLEKKSRELAASVQTQTGVSLEEAEQEVELSVSRLCEWAARCDKERGGVQSLPQSGSSYSTAEPIGVVGVVLPDSKPLLSLVSLLGAAVAMGNAAIMMPSEKNPLPALEFIQVLLAADLPGGVVSIITGARDQLTKALANHSVIQAIWYWGSKEGCQFLQSSSPLRRLWLHPEEQENGERWTRPDASLLEEMWRQAVVWKSLWIPTA
uniref:Aldehyde dehydrogenase domain-containing protein n=1 Tax=Denticeps clupeoides TaxID=299321 RepID=A0AAY4CYK6_9TELE